MTALFRPLIRCDITPTDINYYLADVLLRNMIWHLPRAHGVKCWVAKGSGTLLDIEAWIFTRPIVHCVAARPVHLHLKQCHLCRLLGAWRCSFRRNDQEIVWLAFRLCNDVASYEEGTIIGDILVHFAELPVHAENPLGCTIDYGVEIRRNGRDVCSSSGRSCHQHKANSKEKHHRAVDQRARSPDLLLS